MTLGEKIIRFRAKHRLSQVEFAEMCDISIQTLSAIENEKQAPWKTTELKILMAMEDADNESEHKQD